MIPSAFVRSTPCRSPPTARSTATRCPTPAHGRSTRPRSTSRPATRSRRRSPGSGPRCWARAGRRPRQLLRPRRPLAPVGPARRAAHRGPGPARSRSRRSSRPRRSPRWRKSSSARPPARLPDRRRCGERRGAGPLADRDGAAALPEHVTHRGRVRSTRSSPPASCARSTRSRSSYFPSSLLHSLGLDAGDGHPRLVRQPARDRRRPGDAAGPDRHGHDPPVRGPALSRPGRPRSPSWATRCGWRRQIGAATVSLTGLLPSATDYGRDLAEALAGQDLPRITTGHATTTSAVVLAVRRALEEAGRDLDGRARRVHRPGLGRRRDAPALALVPAASRAR